MPHNYYAISARFLPTKGGHTISILGADGHLRYTQVSIYNRGALALTGAPAFLPAASAAAGLHLTFKWLTD